MYFKIFLPFLVFALFQLINFYFYEGYNLEVSLSNQILITEMYVACILAIVVFCTTYKKNNVFYYGENFNSHKKMEYIMLFMACIFLIKPTIVLFGIGMELGFGYLRANYYTDPLIQQMAYGSNLIVALTNYYINPILWFYLIFISNSKHPRTKKVFFLLLVILVLFNLSYGGRFNIYYSILILYLKVILEGRSVFNSIKKYGYLIAILVFISFWMLFERNVNNQGVLDNVWLGLYEYHNLPTFLLAQKIENKDILVEGYAFKSSFYSLISPLFMIFGLSGDSIPYFYYPVILGKFTLYSFYSENFYNSYTTLFAYFYIDNGYFSPIIIFIHFIILLFYSKIIPNHDIRYKYLCFIVFTLYNSLFMAPFFNPGYVLIIYLFPVVYLIYSKLKYGSS